MVSASSLRTMLLAATVVAVSLGVADDLPGQEPPSPGVIVQGRVLDRGAGGPIQGAAVQIEGTSLLAVTDSAGRYRLTRVPPGPRVIRVEHIRYATTRMTVRVPVSENLDLDIEMAEQALEVEGVTVTADPIGRARGELGSATVVEEEAIRNQVAASLAGVLELLPGVPLTPPGLDAVEQFTLRTVPAGGSSAAFAGGATAADVASFGTVIILDGVPLSNNANLQTTGPRGEVSAPTSAGGGVDLRRIPASTIQRVEVIRGLPSARWGDLTQGAIIVDTKAGAVDPLLSARFDASTSEGTVLGGTVLGPRHIGTVTLDLARTKLARGLTDDEAYRLSTQIAHRALLGGQATGRPEDARVVLDSRMDFFQLVEDNPEDPEVAPGRASRARDRGVRLVERARVALGGESSLRMTLALDHTRQRSFVSRARVRPALPFARTFEEGRAEGKFVGGSYVSEVDLDGDPWLFFGRLEGATRSLAAGFDHNLTVGSELRREWNSGPGFQFDIEFPPQVRFNAVRGFDRPRPFDDIPAIATSAFYVDDRTIRALGSSALLEVQAGLRLDLLHENESWFGGVRDHVLQPRLSIALTPRPWLTMRGSVGRTAKAPALGQLFPAPQYFDVVNVNRFSADPEERLAVLTTFIRDPTNPGLGFSVGTKQELGLDLSLGPSSVISLVAFRDRVSEGVGIRPEPSFLERELFAVSDTVEGNGIPPELVEPPVSVDTVPILIDRPANNLTLKSRGLEITATLPEVRRIRSRLEISGAWVRTEFAKDGLDFGNQFREFQADPRIARIPFWDAVTNSGTRALLTGRLVHHRPEVGLAVTITAQAVLHQSREDLASVDTLSFAGFLTRRGEIVRIPRGERGAPEFEDLRVARSGLIAELTSPATWFLSLQVGKTLPLGGRLSFFAFNALDRQGPAPAADRLPVFIPRLRFGLELSMPGRSLVEAFD